MQELYCISRMIHCVQDLNHRVDHMNNWEQIHVNTLCVCSTNNLIAQEAVHCSVVSKALIGAVKKQRRCKTKALNVNIILEVLMLSIKQKLKYKNCYSCSGLHHSMLSEF